MLYIFFNGFVFDVFCERRLFHMWYHKVRVLNLLFGSICFAVFVTYVTCFFLNSLESAILFAYKVPGSHHS